LTKYTRPLVLGIDQDAPYAQKPLEERLASFGNNTGNLLFAEALYQVVGNAQRATYHFHKDQIDQSDVVVVAAANWINPHGDFGGLAERLKSFGKPVVLVGIGIQVAEGEEPRVFWPRAAFPRMPARPARARRTRCSWAPGASCGQVRRPRTGSTASPIATAST
jgi:hypothetical protein